MWDGKCHFAFLCFGCSFSPNKTCPCFAFVFGWVGYSTLLHDLKTSLGEIEWHNQNTWSESPFLAQSNPFGTLCIGEVRSCRRHFGWRTAIQMESSRTLVFRFQFEYCFNWISCTFDDSRYHVKKWKLMEKFMHVTILFGSCTAIQNASCQINCLDSQMHCPVYVPFTWPSPFPIFPTDDTDNTQRKKLKPFQKTKANKFIGLFGNKVDFNCNHKRPNKMSVFFGILSVKPCDTRFVPWKSFVLQI